jgi:single-strand DNA-binding protein
MRGLELEQSDEDELKPPNWQALKRRRVMSLNRAMVIGNLGADPELRHLPSGQAFTGFSVATDESFADKQGQKQERVEWHHIVAFGNLAESCSQYLRKGRQVYVEGRLRTREFDAKNNGGKRHRTEIIASRVQFLGSPTAEKTEASAIDEPMPPADEVPF